MGTRAATGAVLRWLTTALLIVSAVLPCTAQTPEHRALWAFAWGPGFKSTDEVAALVQRTRLANCNVIAAQVRKSGDAYYFPTRPNRDVRPPVAEVAPDYDPLMDLCTQAHEQGIQVYAWVVAERIASSEPSDTDHVMNRHPDWLTKSISGGTLFGEGYYTDPGHPGAAEYNYNVAMDLVRHYPIDGLVFDYIRYPTTNSGYNDTALARFQARYSPNPPIPYYTDPLWSVWRREQVTHFVRKVYANAMAIRPDIVIAASTIGDKNDAYTNRFQDWRSWMTGGILDCNFPMVYTNNNTTFVTQVGTAVANGGSRHTYVLQGSYNNTISNTMTQIGLARSNGAKGVSIYRYCDTYLGDPNTSADDEPEFYSTLTSGVFAQPVALPAMPWKTSPTVGHVKGVIIDTLQGAGLDAAWVTVSPAAGGAAYGTYSDGTGFYAYMNLAPGDYNVTVSKGMYTETKPVTITAGTVQTVDFLASGVEAASILALKQLPDGTGVSLPEMTVTAGNAQLSGRFYIEDTNQAAGIAVELPADTEVLVYPGDTVKVYGTLGTAANGERCITNPVVYTVDTDGQQIDPLGIRCKDLARTSPQYLQSSVDMNLVGLLVEAVGMVKAVDTSSKCFYIDDGSGATDGSGNVGIRVKYSELADGNPLTPPQINSRVRIRGISSIEPIAGAPRCAVILREQGDVAPTSGVTIQAPQGTISEGWNLISIPGTPLDPTPAAVFSGIPIDGMLSKWNNRTQGLMIYDQWTADAFGGIMRADGYWIQTDSQHALNTTVYNASPTDYVVTLPTAGWTLLGDPFAVQRVWGDVLVTNGQEIQPMLIAAQSRGWLNSMGFWWDSSTQGLCDFGLPEDFMSNNTLEPWHGYWIQTYTDDLSLVFP